MYFPNSCITLNRRFSNNLTIPFASTRDKKFADKKIDVNINSWNINGWTQDRKEFAAQRTGAHTGERIHEHILRLLFPMVLSNDNDIVYKKRKCNSNSLKFIVNYVHQYLPSFLSALPSDDIDRYISEENTKLPSIELLHTKVFWAIGTCIKLLLPIIIYEPSFESHNTEVASSNRLNYSIKLKAKKRRKFIQFDVRWWYVISGNWTSYNFNMSPHSFHLYCTIAQTVHTYVAQKKYIARPSS